MSAAAKHGKLANLSHVIANNVYLVSANSSIFIFKAYNIQIADKS